MSKVAALPEVEPLAMSAGEPALYGVLGMVLHLEILRPDDEARLEAASQRILDWLGDELRFTVFSADEWVQRFRPADLEYISCFCRSLEEPPAPTPGSAVLTSNLVKATRLDYEVSCKGGEDDANASPYLVRFCAEIPEVRRGDHYQPYAVLTLSVPENYPLEVFRDNVLGIVSDLRVRWGTAGYTYAAWELSDFSVPRARVHSHARRYPGYDVGYFAGDMSFWYNELRTVSWYTFLGENFEKRLIDARKELVSRSPLSVGRAGETLYVQAGPQPERGDVNRLGYPAAYIAADKLLRPVRAPDGAPFVFMDRWTESRITEWIRRFERRLG